jgi:hypothetical protein
MTTTDHFYCQSDEHGHIFPLCQGRDPWDRVLCHVHISIIPDTLLTTFAMILANLAQFCNRRMMALSTAFRFHRAFVFVLLSVIDKPNKFHNNWPDATLKTFGFFQCYYFTDRS